MLRLVASLAVVIGLMALFAGVLYRYFTEEREKRVVRTAFSRYVSGAVVNEIVWEPCGVTVGEGADAAPVPTLDVAATVNV
mgnify:CR=1 FL=1